MEGELILLGCGILGPGIEAGVDAEAGVDTEAGVDEGEEALPFETIDLERLSVLTCFDFIALSREIIFFIIDQSTVLLLILATVFLTNGC